MAEARENATRSSRDMAAVKFPELSLQLNRFPRDLTGFAVPVASETQRNPGNGKNFYGIRVPDEYEEEEIELNLGLSLGGRFGVDKYSGKLKRSSSIVGTTPVLRLSDEASSAAVADPYKEAGLKRTTSLPVEMEEEWRKRKEIQTLRRMEAKRRRSEKQKDGIWNQRSSETNLNFEEEVSRGNTAPFGLERWVSAAEKSGFLPKLPVPRQGSADSDGGGGSSSGMSELENKTPHDKSSRKNNSSSVEKRGKETATAKEDMPCVFTKGLGPNGRRVEGILYKYGKGEEVRIMCVCHGDFLSPAEFVKHAGGGDVENPLRHIVVNTSSSSSSFL